MIPNKGNFIVADSSFYICFLEDIKRPNELILILNKFEFALGDKIKFEISKCEHYKLIEDNKHINIISGYNFSEVFKPFFSNFENEKGEGEAIALAAILYSIKRIGKLVLDEASQREFVKTHIANLIPLMTGTAGFLSKCCTEICLFDKTETLQILSEIEASNFRISKEVLSEVRSSLK